MLTEQKKHACREFVGSANFNMTKALLAAGYSKRTASGSGSRMFAEPEMKAYIAELMKPTIEKQQLTADMVLSEMRKLAFADIKTYYKWSVTKNKFVLKPLDELTDEQTAAIKSYKPGEYYELYSKEGSLDKLARYFKLYSEIDATVTQFVLMPTIKRGGREIVFEVGKAAPKAAGQKKV